MSARANKRARVVHTATDAKPLLPQDIFLCVMYNRNDAAIRPILRGFVSELSKEHDCRDIAILVERLPLIGLRAMFFLLIVIDHKLRHWAMAYEDSQVIRPQPEKVCRFLRTLRDGLVPAWMADERNLARDLVRKATELYIRC